MNKIIFEKYIKKNLDTKHVNSLVLTLENGEQINIVSAEKVSLISNVLLLEYSENYTCIDFDHVVKVSINKK